MITFSEFIGAMRVLKEEELSGGDILKIEGVRRRIREDYMGEESNKFWLGVEMKIRDFKSLRGVYGAI